MPKDNENILLPLDGPTTPSQPMAFGPDEMIRCDTCLRANAPTRAACLYCGASLPVTESSSRLRKPLLLTPDKSEPGYNTILVAHDKVENLPQAAELLKLSTDAVAKLIAAAQPLPLARTASLEESELLAERLNQFGLQTETISDQRLCLSDSNVIRVRSMILSDEMFSVRTLGRGEPLDLRYSNLILMVQGRLLTKTTSVKERKSRKSENEILEATEFYSDELVFDLYCARRDQTFRVAANSFDFSCLREQKALVVNENMRTLIQVLQNKAPQVKIENSYAALRPLLDLVWGSEKATKSDGWRRDAPGRLTVAATTIVSNETQFTRYSRLKRILLRQE
ncbi:MAG TPA: hypothetical protein VF251_06145 [Pyrinomonadaceae bacterium]